MSFALNVASVASVAKSYAKSSVRTGETSSRLVTTRFTRREHSANLACDARVRSAEPLRSGPDWRVFGLVGALAMSGFPVIHSHTHRHLLYLHSNSKKLFLT